VVIPKAIRDRLGLKRGQELQVDVADGVIQMRPCQGKRHAADDWRRWRGVLKGTNALQELEAEHRWEIERDERR
jgi:AbrB family looped-hinge helix DNA binding protein